MNTITILFIAIAAVNPSNGNLNSLNVSTTVFADSYSCYMAQKVLDAKIQPDVHLAMVSWCAPGADTSAFQHVK